MFLALAGVPGCNGSPSEVVILVPGAMEMMPADTAIPQRDSFALRVTVYDTAGIAIPLRPAFESSDTTQLTVSSAGVVKSTGPTGSARITAILGPFVRQTMVTTFDTIVATRAPLGGAPYSAAMSASGVVYVTQPHASRVARVDLAARTITAAIPVGLIPTEVAFNSSGSHAYVTNQFSQNVGVIDVATSSQIDVIPVTGDPFDLIVAPGDSVLFVGTNVNRVYRIQIATKTVTDSFPTGGVANGMLIRDSLLYASTHQGGTVIEYNLRTRSVARSFMVGGTPQKLAISPDGDELYIANEAGYVQFWDRIAGTQIGTNLLLTGSAGYGIARRASDGLLYVTGAYFGGGRIYVVNPTTRSIVRTATLGGSTREVLFDASGAGFVPNEAGWLDFLK